MCGSLIRDRIVIQWVLLELNILCFIPIFISRKGVNSSINSLKYFISQRAASLLFIIFFFSYFLFRGDLFVFLMLFKIGIPPFQGWVISILSSIGIGEIYLLFSIQKFIPIIILSNLVNEKVIVFFLIMSILLVISYIKYLSSLVIILFISSVVNSIWVISSILNGGWFIFFIIYCLILGGLIFSLVIFNIKKIIDLKEGERMPKFIISFHLFNIGGVPPMLGFVIKLILLLKLLNIRIFYIGVLLFSSFVLLIIYTILIYQVVCLTPSLNRLRREKVKYSYMMVLVSLGLIFLPAVLI